MMIENEQCFIDALKSDLNKPVQVAWHRGLIITDLTSWTQRIKEYIVISKVVDLQNYRFRVRNDNRLSSSKKNT